MTFNRQYLSRSQGVFSFFGQREASTSLLCRQCGNTLQAVRG